MANRNRASEPAAAPAPAAPDEPAATWEPIGSLVPWARNPRDHTKSMPHTIESIRRYGFGSPIVARPSDRRIMVGEGRWRAATSLGHTHVPVRWRELSDEDARDYALADNAIPKLSTERKDELDALLAEADRPIPGLELKPIDVGDTLSIDETFDAPVRDEFWMVIRGPMALQLDALRIADELGAVCDVQSGTIRK